MQYSDMLKNKMIQKMTKTTDSKRPNDWSAEDKLKVALEASSLSDEQLGAFLRSKGLHQATETDGKI